jgi:hypothetical protein
MVVERVNKVPVLERKVADAELKMIDIVSSQPRKTQEQIRIDLKHLAGLYQEYNNTVEQTIKLTYNPDGSIADVKLNPYARTRQISWVAKRMYEYLFGISSHL